jgi:hypothetical protein
LLDLTMKTHAIKERIGKLGVIKTSCFVKTL